MSQENMNNNAQHYLAEFDQFQETVERDWFSEQRQSALKLFIETGFPSSRLENWKYTDVRPIAKQSFSNVSTTTSITTEEIDAIRFQDIDCYELVFINGVYSKEHSRLDGLTENIVIENMADALAKDKDLLEKHLSQYADNNVSPFTALNTAFIQHGTYINVPKNTVVDKPINILYLSKDNAQPLATHPRNLVIMGEHAEATLIENYIGLDDANYFTNVVTEVSLSTASILKHYKIQQESVNAYHIGNLNVTQGKDSLFKSHSISLGGSLVRNDIYGQLAAEGASIVLNGLYMTDGKQHVDNHTRVDHLKPNTHSTENYRGVLNGKSRGVFNGKVVVHPQAQKIEAHQNNANLLLSDDAEIDTKPELEIYADDVKCSHGATVGQLDKNMLFYLRSRAIDEDTARSLLTYAFVNEIISDISLVPIKNRLEHLIIGQLPDAELIREFTNE
ncbi:MAG TPA: Fe-S cluster assembly protein SufD [Thiotrichaceae bacterium]|jgi:Fe-S cluster assembly protein SufD|nr:Fe-S cluster assembly protein SufD [Thiotrichaceae bacterium]HIM08110.1 Fe-S cluster assembly protein SufD [Gammaproteobacteria bacterium]